MKIKIIFPKSLFTQEQLEKLEKYEVEFIEGKELEVDKIENLFIDDDYILAVDPTYLKDGWSALPMEKIEKMTGLKALCLSTTSFSWVDVRKLADLGVVITNTPGKSTEAVAEFNVFMMFSLLRKLALVAKNNWEMDYDLFVNEEIAGLTAGIIGLGNIGNKVAELCRGLGMNVCFWNRTPKESVFSAVELSELFSRADVVFNTLATPPELHGFLNKDLLGWLKEKAMIVSTSDTSIFDDEFILEQVKNNKLGGYAFESDSKKLSDYDGNVMVFPEQAYYTQGTLLNTAAILTNTILSIVEGKPINKVN